MAWTISLRFVVVIRAFPPYAVFGVLHEKACWRCGLSGIGLGQQALQLGHAFCASGGSWFKVGREFLFVVIELLLAPHALDLPIGVRPGKDQVPGLELIHYLRYSIISPALRWFTRLRVHGSFQISRSSSVVVAAVPAATKGSVVIRNPAESPEPVFAPYRQSWDFRASGAAIVLWWILLGV